MGGLGYGFAQRGLADSRRAVEADDGGLHVALELQHSQVLDYPLLDCFQAEVVLVQDFLGVLEVQIVLCHIVPWKIQDELNVLVLDVVVGRVGIGPFKFTQFSLKCLGCVLRPFFLLGSLAQFIYVLSLVHA